MLIEDRGAKLPHYAITSATNYESTTEMLRASKQFEHQSAVSILLGLGGVMLGAKIHKLANKTNDDLSNLGLGVVAGGATEILKGLSQWETRDSLRHGASRIDWALAKNAAVIKLEK